MLLPKTWITVVVLVAIVSVGILLLATRGNSTPFSTVEDAVQQVDEATRDYIERNK